MIKLLKTLRTHWKKSTLGAVLLFYGGRWGMNKHWEHEMRRAYCQEAKKFGEVPAPMGSRLTKITVFLNPSCNKGEGLKLYEQNAAPVLNMAGLQVSTIKTEYEGQVKKYMEVLEDTDAILVAGGDGTLSEVVTGLLRRHDKERVRQIPIGVIPAGKTNKFVRKLTGQDTVDAYMMLNAAMSVVKWVHQPADVMMIKSLDGGEKEVYAMSELCWSSLRDADRRKEKYWYLWGLKHRFSYFRSALSSDPKAKLCHLQHTPPCQGCSRCVTLSPPPVKRWWHAFLPPAPKVPTTAELLAKLDNPECGKSSSEEVSSLELLLSTHTRDKPEDRGMCVAVAPSDESFGTFFSAGMKRVRQPGVEVEDSRHLEARTITLLPQVQAPTEVQTSTEEQEEGEEVKEKPTQWFVIDSEEYEAMPVQVTLLRDYVQIFTSDDALIPKLPVQGTIFWDFVDWTKDLLGFRESKQPQPQIVE